MIRLDCLVLLLLVSCVCLSMGRSVQRRAKRSPIVDSSDCSKARIIYSVASGKILTFRNGVLSWRVVCHVGFNELFYMQFHGDESVNVTTPDGFAINETWKLKKPESKTRMFLLRNNQNVDETYFVCAEKENGHSALVSPNEDAKRRRLHAVTCLEFGKCASQNADITNCGISSKAARQFKIRYRGLYQEKTVEKRLREECDEKGFGIQSDAAEAWGHF